MENNFNFGTTLNLLLINVSVHVTTCRRCCQHYLQRIKYYDNVSPLPQQILSTPESIFKSSIGLSSKKIENIKILAARIIAGRVNLSILPEMTFEEIVAQLIQVKVVGMST